MTLAFVSYMTLTLEIHFWNSHIAGMGGSIADMYENECKNSVMLHCFNLHSHVIFVHCDNYIVCTNWSKWDSKPTRQKYGFLSAVEWTEVDGWHITHHKIKPVVEVSSLEACQQLCLATTMCKAISYIHDIICHMHNVTRLQAGVYWVTKQKTKYCEFYRTPLGMIERFTVRLAVVD